MNSPIASSVSELNDLLGQFKDANTDIVSGTRNGRDVSDLTQPARRAAQTDIDVVGISTYSRSDNDMVIVTKDGATLCLPFRTGFLPAAERLCGRHSRRFRIYRRDTAAGRQRRRHQFLRCAGLVQLRDSVAGTMQSRLDEVARGLVTAFAETDASGGPLPPRCRHLHLGWRSRDSRRRVDGLARTISTQCRLGTPRLAAIPTCCATAGPTGPSMFTIPGGGASYADLLISYSEKLDEPIAFDAAAAIGTTQSVSSFSSQCHQLV